MTNEPRALASADVTEAFVERFYDSCIDSWYEEGPIDWEDAIDRAERAFPEFTWEGPDFWLQPAIRKLQRAVRNIHAEATA